MSESRKKILDVGCGSGMYVDEYRNAGHEAYGVDLCVIEDPEKPYLRKLDILGDDMKAFVKEVGLLDYVISLEVGEHLRPRDSQAYVDALCSASTDTIIFSAAHPGQGGSGHINCQPKE